MASSADDHAAVCQTCRTPFSMKPLQRLRRQPVGQIFERISTNPYFDSTAVRSLSGGLSSRLLASMVPGCIVLQEPSAEVSVLRRDHWTKGVFLIGGVFRGAGHGNCDALIGVNLAGARHPMVISMDPSLPLLEAHLSSQQVSLCRVTGGPVQPRSILVLISVLCPLADEALPASVRPVFPVQTSSDSEAPATRHNCGGALFGEPADVLNVLRQHPSLQVVGAVAFQGHAVWSSTQLLAEVARGSWCLTHATSDELAVVTPLEPREELWHRLWNTRTVFRQTPSVPPRRADSDSALPGCRCVIS